MSVIVTDEERASWNVTAMTSTKNTGDVAECLCSEIIVPNRTMATKAGNPINSIVMMLTNENTGAEITAYFNHTRSKSGTVTVKPESRFARLHRLTTGKYKRNDYSRAECLFRSLKDLSYFVTYIEEKTKFGSQYLKALTVKPVDPITSELWNEHGRLILKKQSPREALTAVKTMQNLCKTSVKTMQKPCKTSVIENAEEPHYYLGLPAVPTTLSHNCIINLPSSHITTARSSPIPDEVTNSKAPKEYTEFF